MRTRPWILGPLLLSSALACEDEPTTTVPPTAQAIPIAELQTKRIQLLCDLLFRCDAAQYGTTSARFVFTDAAQCATYLRDSNSIDDLQRAVTAGVIRYDSAAAGRCLQELNSCAALSLSEDNETADCKATFVGTVAMDGACQRSEECAGETYCAATAGNPSCPGACKARLAVGSTCVSNSQCAGTARCVTDDTTFESNCLDLTRPSPAAEGASCGFDRAAATDTPCATGLYCNRGTHLCERPIATGVACTGNGDRCAGVATCVAGAQAEQRTCEAITLVRTQGGACDERTTYCSPLDGLECVDGICVDDREPAGPSGARCRRSDYAARCDAGLYCGGAGSAAEPMSCRPKVAIGAACGHSDACANGSCVNDICAARDCQAR